jgi:dolichol-phosphate hexosyltransferase
MGPSLVARLAAYVGPDGNRPLPPGDLRTPIFSTLSILLPALNEEGGIRKVLQELPGTELRRRGLRYEVVLLDGHSTDQTRSVARRLGAEVFVQSGRGKGSAFREFLPNLSADVTVVLDSDGTYPPQAIPQLVGALGPRSPVVLGSRFRGSNIEPGAMSRLNYVGNRFLSRFASLLFGVPISDVCSGMWAFRSDRLKSLDLSAEGFELEVDIFAECALRHIPIAEIPIAYRRRLGHSKILIWTGFRIAFALLKKRIRSRLGGRPEERAEADPWPPRATRADGAR